ncbi:hypothetical protein HNQ94_001197 [Salirhabdus euzebyi]|uniref:Uncharacterized protein n=1 Tax=Salirhabdus euzebyi TaxID=394506 RepID=A0A841PZE9_9BACI|nr:hypothetical protein [Salirhabdus euzebyi]MBB6452751.1 hypothetical protein [Salirhabdus euzebyi]
MQIELVMDILFGVSGGLLSLVGLIAIFVTLNTQYNIEKAREVLWKLRESYQFFDPAEAERKHGEINWLLKQYVKFIKLDRPIKISIKIGIRTIVIVGVSWYVFLLLSASEFTNNILLGFIWIVVTLAILLLFQFAYLLNKLKDISAFVNIPSRMNMSDGTHRLEKDSFDESLAIAELALIDSKFMIQIHKGAFIKLFIYSIRNVKYVKAHYSFSYENRESKELTSYYVHHEKLIQEDWLEHDIYITEDESLLYAVHESKENLKDIILEHKTNIFIQLDITLKDDSSFTTFYTKEITQEDIDGTIVYIYPASKPLEETRIQNLLEDK